MELSDLWNVKFGALWDPSKVEQMDSAGLDISHEIPTIMPFINSSRNWDTFSKKMRADGYECMRDGNDHEIDFIDRQPNHTNYYEDEDGNEFEDDCKEWGGETVYCEGCNAGKDCEHGEHTGILFASHSNPSEILDSLKNSLGNTNHYYYWGGRRQPANLLSYANDTNLLYSGELGIFTRPFLSEPMNDSLEGVLRYPEGNSTNLSIYRKGDVSLGKMHRFVSSAKEKFNIDDETPLIIRSREGYGIDPHIQTTVGEWLKSPHENFKK